MAFWEPIVADMTETTHEAVASVSGRQSSMSQPICERVFRFGVGLHLWLLWRSDYWSNMFA
jgi:hypothetical protein